jgi:hypothetical protein
MKKFFSILLAFSLLQVGFAYAADTSTATLEDRDYIFGVSNQSEVNLNQVLFLLAGKDGEPGAAGRDGIDGINGLDGINGKDGQNGVDGNDGKDGRDGKDGINGRDGRDGTNGTSGTNGKDGKYGKNGVNGTGGTGAPFWADYRNGREPLAGCTESATVTMRPSFNGTDFTFKRIDFKEVNDDCQAGNKRLVLYFSIGDGRLNNGTYALVKPTAGTYTAKNQVVTCEYIISELSPLVDTPGRIKFSTSEGLKKCTNSDITGSAFELTDIYTADTTNVLGLEIYEP